MLKYAKNQTMAKEIPSPSFNLELNLSGYEQEVIELPEDINLAKEIIVPPNMIKNRQDELFKIHATHINPDNREMEIGIFMYIHNSTTTAHALV